jgi:inosine triphosphate pyrophosphatase
MGRENRILFVTGSSGKVAEAQAILTNWKVEQVDFDLPEIQSIEPAEIVEEKVKLAAGKIKGPFFVEDTSVHFACLGGLPGPFIRSFLRALGRDGLASIAQKLGNLSAEAKSTVGYYDGDGLTFIFQGSVKGKIAQPRGGGGFGWDAIFVPEGHERTFAEMGAIEKNRISHRRIALDKLRSFLEGGTK